MSAGLYYIVDEMVCNALIEYWHIAVREDMSMCIIYCIVDFLYVRYTRDASHYMIWARLQ